MLAVTLTVPSFVFAQTLTVTVGTPPAEVEENFVDLTIDPQLKTPSSWSLFWTKEMQDLSLLVTVNSIADATKRVKYSEESIQLAKFVITESDDASHSGIMIDLIKRSEDLIINLNSNKDKFLLKDNQSAKNLAQNIAVHLKHREDTMITVSTKIGADVLRNGGISGVVFSTAFDDLKSAVVKFRQEITEAAKTLSNKVRGTGTFKNDQDRDGVPDDMEKEMGLSIADPDTDGDGLSDKKEIEVYGTDPTKVDTDGDGFWDGMEIINGYNPLGNGKLDDKAIKQRSANSEKFFERLKTQRLLTTSTLNYFKVVKTKFIYVELTPP